MESATLCEEGWKKAEFLSLTHVKKNPSAAATWKKKPLTSVAFEYGSSAEKEVGPFYPLSMTKGNKNNLSPTPRGGVLHSHFSCASGRERGKAAPV